MLADYAASLAAMLVITACGPAFAQDRPRPSSAPTSQAPPATDASQSSPERDSAFITAGLGFGQKTSVAGDLHVGWMFAPWIGAFASLGASIAQDRDTSSRAIGVRVANGPVFAEGEIASRTVYPDCESASCAHHTLHVGIVRAGLEV